MSSILTNVQAKTSTLGLAPLPRAQDTERRRSGQAGHVLADRLTQTLYYAQIKPLLDVTLVLLSLPVALPLIAVAALLVMLDGGKPFFGHVRIGRHGRPFHCWKLRTMVPDAEARLTAHLAANPVARAQWDAHFKLDCDPRITRLGRFLRKTSLDELPQLWNVLRGEMSLVGSRPVTEAELAKYADLLPFYLAQRPGVTGLWQVSGRNAVSYDDRVALDVRYLRDSSLMMDLALIAATAVAVFRKTGL